MTDSRCGALQYLRRLGLGCLILATAVAGAACGGGGDDSGGTGGDGSRTRSHLATITIPALTLGWAGPFSLTGGGGNVNEMVFVSTSYLYVDGIRRDGGTYYEFASDGTVAVNGTYIKFFEGAWTQGLVDSVPSVVLPPIASAAGDFPGDNYYFKLTNPTGSDETVQVYQVYKNDSSLSSGNLVVNLIVYTDGTPNDLIPDAAAAESVKNYLNRIFNAAGITVSTINVEFRTDANAVATVLDDNGMVNFLNTASAQTGARTDNGINCFLFPQLAGNTLGLDGAIPGPGTLHGTIKSGLIAQASLEAWSVNGYSDLEASRAMLAKILGHEMGHYLGLFHTTERTGDYSGGVTDTPWCKIANDSNNDGLLSGPECRGKGADYLMFWTTDIGLIQSGNFQTVMSPQESSVANTHPSVL